MSKIPEILLALYVGAVFVSRLQDIQHRHRAETGPDAFARRRDALAKAARHDLLRSEAFTQRGQVYGAERTQPEARICGGREGPRPSTVPSRRSGQERTRRGIGR